MRNEMRDDEHVEIPPDAILRTTRQLWKLVVAGLVLPFPTALLAFWFLRRLGPDQSAAAMIAGIAVVSAAAGLIAWLLWSVKCPRCGTRWVRRLFADPDGAGALTRFLKMRSCPECAYAAPTIGRA